MVRKSGCSMKFSENNLNNHSNRLGNRNMYATIAYAGQQPWLVNGTIRDNILFGESYRPKRYEEVIESCALKSDIEIMSNGDLTQVGERGMTLSGGQKMRKCIARAFYSSANVIILDDVLSSLDNQVVSWIIEKCLKLNLAKYKRTIILVTQKTQLVYNADYLIAIEKLKIRVSWVMNQVKERDPAIIREWDLAIAKENAKESQLSPIGRSARERWKLFKNISRIGLLQQRPSPERDNLSTNNSIYNTPFKRTSSISFGSRLWSDLPLPIDECNDNDFDFNQMPEVRKKPNSFRVVSLQPRAVSAKTKEPLTRNISSPVQFNPNAVTASDYLKSRDIDCASELSLNKSIDRKISFRKFLRRMSSRRRKSQTDNSIIDHEKRKSDKTLSISSITETEETINNSVDVDDDTITKRDEHERSCSMGIEEEMEDDESVNLEDESALNRLKYDEKRRYGKIPARKTL
ncbi:CLUMA_CG006547, isoform A [Clunio marinus]|uniref:CLUMA_CG006547, isoform A n=1 Tax=Clunio marinus TaxID=568069 RepID=A0A1J1HYL5_9DIPT|nr:CLUMA_CG006547, isoform A [Clunio marinus]